MLIKNIQINSKTFFSFNTNKNYRVIHKKFKNDIANFSIKKSIKKNYLWKLKFLEISNKRDFNRFNNNENLIITLSGPLYMVIVLQEKVDEVVEHNKRNVFSLIKYI